MREKRIRMTLFLIVILISLGGVQCHAENLYLSVKGKKVGMVDAQGNEVIPVQYAEVVPWGKYYRVREKNRFGIFNDKGQVMLPIEYSQLTMLNCYGKALICKGGTFWWQGALEYSLRGRFGIIDKDLNMIVPCEHKGLFEFRNDASEKRYYGEGLCLDDDNVPGPANFRHSYLLTDTLSTDCRYIGISDNQGNTEKAGIADGYNGKKLVPNKVYDIVFMPVNGMSRWYMKKRSSVTYGYVNVETGESFEVGSADEKLENLTYMTHSDFHGNVAAVNDGKTWRLINRSGETLRNDYKDIRYSLATHIWVGHHTNGTLDVFDEDGRDKAGFQGYTDIILSEDMGDKVLFPVKNKDGNWGILNAEGAVVAPFIYEEISTGRCDVLGVKKGGLWGFLSNQGKELLPCRYTGVTMPAENDAAFVWVRKSDSLWYKANVYTKKEAAAGYERVEAFKDGLAWVRPSDLNTQNGILATALVPVETDANQAVTKKKNDDDEEEESAVIPESQDYVQKWGVIINEQEDVLFPEAVSAEYLPQIKAAIKKKGGALTRSEAHAFLLKMSADKRMYLMTKKIDDNDWDY